MSGKINESVGSRHGELEEGPEHKNVSPTQVEHRMGESERMKHHQDSRRLGKGSGGRLDSVIFAGIGRGRDGDANTSCGVRLLSWEFCHLAGRRKLSGAGGEDEVDWVEKR